MKRYVAEYKSQELNPKSSKTLLVIPVINEGIRIQNQIESIHEKKLSIDIVIADGGSTDNSLQNSSRLAELGVKSIITKIGPGKLSSQLQTAFDYALNQGYENVITMDGNGKDRPGGIIEIEKALNLGFDFVQGSRFVTGGVATNTPFIRDLAIKWIHSPITSVAAGRRFTDSTNGFRGYSKRLLKSSEISIFRDVFDTYELIFYLPIRASRSGFKICEVPVTREYPKIGPTPTKIIGMFAYVKLLKILFWAAIGRYNPKK
jgi:glycosyltransferase involved in cell wall biosynthesis